MRAQDRTKRYCEDFNYWSLGQKLFESYQLSSSRNMVCKGRREDYPLKTWEQLKEGERSHWELVANQPLY